MYFGSVSFFKHFIIGIIAVVFTVLLSLTAFYGAKSVRLQTEVDTLQTLLTERNQSESGNQIGESSGKGDGRPRFMYQVMYPEMVVEPAKVFAQRAENTAYLTFNDDTSEYTEKILEILEKNSIKATFFIADIETEKQREMLRKISDAGHEIGVHSGSGVYHDVYGSVESYIEDFKLVYGDIVQIAGRAPTVFRFLGGSINSYNQHMYKELIAEMTRRGFTYYDWNVAGLDSLAGATAQSVANNIRKSLANTTRPIVLLHDGVKCTVDALPTVINMLKEKNYGFAAITNSVVPITFSYID